MKHKKLLAQQEKLKEIQEREGRARQDHTLIIRMYEMLVNLQCDLARESRVNKINEMKNQVENLNREIEFMKNDTEYMEKRRNEMLREIY